MGQKIEWCNEGFFLGTFRTNLWELIIVFDLKISRIQTQLCGAGPTEGDPVPGSKREQKKKQLCHELDVEDI